MVEVAMGDRIKKLHSKEIENLEVVRKSVVAVHQEFSMYNVTSKRPVTGKSPMKYWDIFGEKYNRVYYSDELI